MTWWIEGDCEEADINSTYHDSPEYSPALPPLAIEALMSPACGVLSKSAPPKAYRGNTDCEND